MIAVLAVMFALLPGAGEARAQRGAFDHSALDTLLAGNVHDGRVDYERIAATRLAPLDAYLGRLAAAEPDSLTGDEQLAFYINLYNATMIRAVIAHLAQQRPGPGSAPAVARNSVADPAPAAGRRSVPGRAADATRNSAPRWSPADSSFAVFHQPLVRLRGGTLSLDVLENQLLRPRFHDPRIHVALVCAARSCPPLLPRAYRGRGLDSTLANNLRAFAADRTRNRMDSAPRRLELSAIFEWYAADFAPAGGAAAVIGRSLGRDFTGWALSYLPYDWTLNDLAR